MKDACFCSRSRSCSRNCICAASLAFDFEAFVVEGPAVLVERILGDGTGASCDWLCINRFGVEALFVMPFTRGGCTIGPSPPCPRAFSTFGRLKRLKSDIFEVAWTTGVDAADKFNGEGGSAFSRMSEGRTRRLWRFNSFCRRSARVCALEAESLGCPRGRRVEDLGCVSSASGSIDEKERDTASAH